MEDLLAPGECDISFLGIVSVVYVYISWKPWFWGINKKLNFINGIKCLHMFFYLFP